MYTNATDYLYGGGGSNLHRNHLASLFEGLNATYENSGMQSRAQVAGVVWDKTYADTFAGCETLEDLIYASNGMGRYVDLMQKYAADVIVLVHPSGPSKGCGDSLPLAETRGYAAFSARRPDDLHHWAHGMGHAHGLGHCNGHRVTVVGSGATLGGPSPDPIPYALGQTSSGFAVVDPPVETTVLAGYAVAGFHTAMQSPGGELCHTIEGPFVYGGVSRMIAFFHSGTFLSGGTAWTGTYSSPYGSWTHAASNVSHPTGGAPVTYLNRVKYYQVDTITHLGTTSYYRNSAAQHDANAPTLVNFTGVPSTLTLTPDMSLGPNSADSQWVHAHFAATGAVTVEPGFRLAGDASMKISVGGTGGLARRPAPQGESAAAAIAATAAFHLDAGGRAVFTLAAPARVTIEAFAPDGRRAAVLLSESLQAGDHARSLNTSGLPRGLYIYRLKAGSFTATRKAMVGK